jgi:hypothetical protein
MEAILVPPESVAQLKTVKAVLKALNVQFELQSDSLPPHVLKGLEKSIQQVETGNTISFHEFKEKHFIKK